MMCNSLNILKNNSQYPIFTLNYLNFKENDLNNYCFDCGRKDPEYISINNGIFICGKCAMVHMLFPGGSSILIKNDIKSLSEKEIEFIKCGGNKKLYEFIYNQCPPLMNLPKQYLYTSPILNSYQNQLLQSVNKKISRRTKIFNFKKNPNYFLKEIDSSSKRCNTDLLNFDILNDEKTIFKNKIKYQFNDDYNNFFNQKTINTHANTISNSNTLTYLSERTNENFYNIINNDNKKKSIEQKSRIILTNVNIVYNKPKISSSFNIMKLDKNRDKNNINSKNYNISINTTLNNNNNNNYFYSNNTIDYNKLARDSLDIFQTPQKANTTRFFFYNKKKNNNNKLIEKRNKSERTIKEIIINKKMNKLNFDNSASKTNKLWYKTKAYFQKRKQIEEINNKSLNNSETKNISNKYTTDLNLNNLNESIINNNNIKTIEINNRYKCRYINVNKQKIFDNINIKKNTDSNKKKNNNYIIDSNNIEININNNLKKEKQIIININDNNNYNKNDQDENGTVTHKKNRLSSNFFINKKKLDIKEMKKLYFKNKKINNIIKENRIDENESKENEKKLNNKSFIRKDNKEHFHILSKDNKKRKEKNTFKEKEKNIFRTTLLKRNMLNKNKSVTNNSYLNLDHLEISKSGETSRYSIRNKYKKDKSLQK